MDNASTEVRAPERTGPRRRAWRDGGWWRRAAGSPAAANQMLATVRRLAAYARPHRTAIVASVVLFFASSAIDPVVPAFFKWLLDHGFKPETGFRVWPIPLVVVGLFAVRGALA